MLGMHATAARHDGGEYVEFGGGSEVRGDRLPVAAGWRPRVQGIGLETLGVGVDPSGIGVDAHLRVGERLWIGDVNGIWPAFALIVGLGILAAAPVLVRPPDVHSRP